MNGIQKKKKVLNDMSHLRRLSKNNPHIKELMDENSRLRREIKILKIDPLTGLNNRSGGERALEAEINRFLRSKSHNNSISMIFIDGDNIKAINDKYGHAVGDKVIKVIAESIKASQRDYDTAYRYGGDEFIVILPDTDEIGAFSFVKRISKSLEKEVSKISTEKNNLTNISVSCGYHTLRYGEARDAVAAIKILLKKSDKMMYKNKEAKRIK